MSALTPEQKAYVNETVAKLRARPAVPQPAPVLYWPVCDRAEARRHGMVARAVLFGLAVGAVVLIGALAGCTPAAACDNDGKSACDAGQARQARAHGKRSRRALDPNGSGVVRSGKTGATARVASRYRAAFQAYVDDVEAAGGRVTFMGGIRRGPCSIPRSKHPCGMALDLCQFGRGIVDRRCALPRAAELARIAARHGMVEGGQWCHGDKGHAEIRTARQAEGCGTNLYSAVSKWKGNQ
ncbi:MAG: M15 family metallopeptidase domain-containing protein [Rhodospirillaceae bacterium]